ncbi:MAG: D-TA family PLP-dependent enzyme [Bacteroidota bacterium]
MPIDINDYKVENIALIDSPALLVYRERVEQNIRRMLEMAGSAERLIPHVKTHKMAAVIQLYLEAGIKKFKCATIAEAEMTASSGAEEVVLAYQPVGPKLNRWISLIQRFPWVRFSALVDDAGIIKQFGQMAEKQAQNLWLLLDINGGMGRTGVSPSPQAKALYRQIHEHPLLTASGLHAYDGHVRKADLQNRKAQSDADFSLVQQFRAELKADGMPVKRLITAGSPSFPTHLDQTDIELSPGTTIFWDAGYGSTFEDMPFEPAALVLSRVISKPAPDRLCLDLGHKSIASENPPEKRVVFPEIEVEKILTHSEEHLVIQTPQAANYQVGDVLYGLPWHICPTVALHQEGIVIEEGKAVGHWPVTARDRRIQI